MEVTDSCRFEHIGFKNNGTRSSNPFNVLQNNLHSNNRGTFNRMEPPSLLRALQISGSRLSAILGKRWAKILLLGTGFDSAQHGSRSLSSPSVEEYRLNQGEIEKDLAEPPVWILSCYGPGKDAPVQLFGGEPREISFEEARLKWYELGMQNRILEANAAEDKLRVDAEQQMQNAKADVRGAIRYIVEGVNQHPNRIDICHGEATSFGKSVNDRLLQQQNTMHQPGFGQQKGQQGQRAQTAFGGPSQSPFTQLGGQSGFGQPSPMVQQPGISPFSKTPSQSAFGQPSVPSSFQQSSSQSPFKQQQTQLISDTVQSQSAFKVDTGAFVPGSSQKSPSNPFANLHQASKFPSSALVAKQGTDQAIESSASPFKNQQDHVQEFRPVTAVKEANGSITSIAGKPVFYEENVPYIKIKNGCAQKVWFPRGKTFSKPEDLPIEKYSAEIEEAYRKAKQKNGFQQDSMPEVPPKREWTTWTF